MAGTYGVIGADEFDPPEMFLVGDPDRHKPSTDVFCLGRLLEFCLCGRVRAMDEGINETYGNMNLTVRTLKAIEVATQKSPGKRPATVAEYLEILQKGQR